MVSFTLHFQLQPIKSLKVYLIVSFDDFFNKLFRLK